MRTILISSAIMILSAGLCSGQITLKKMSEDFVFHSQPFAQCHASTIVEVIPGKFMVAAFGGPGESDKNVCIWLASGSDGLWSVPVMAGDGVVNDTLRYACWNPVLFKSKAGRLFLFYKVGPKVIKWWGMVRKSDDEGKTWSSPERLPDGILGPIKNKPVQLADGSIIAPSSVETAEGWKVHIERSADGGNSWQFIPVDPETEFNVIQPTVLVHSGSNLQILCRSRSNLIVQAFSEDNGKSWSRITGTGLPNPNSGIDAVTLKNGWFLLVYNPTVQGKNDRSKLNVAVSRDGKNWSDSAVLENEEHGEYSYPAVIQAADGKIHITYTYNRVNIKHVVFETTD